MAIENLPIIFIFAVVCNNVSILIGTLEYYS